MKSIGIKFIVFILSICSLLCFLIGCGNEDKTDGNVPQEHTCEYNQQVIEDKYKASDATCGSKAKYYYSCTCGEKGVETFEYGSEPSHTYGEWVSNNDGTHSKICSQDNSHILTENCQGTISCNNCGFMILKSTEGLTFKVVDSEVYVIGYTGTSKEIVIPNVYEGNPVTTIDENAFIDNADITSITLPINIRNVNNALKIVSLTSIVVDENNVNYKSIDGNLYSRDEKNLIQYAIGKTDTEFKIPETVTTISAYAFKECKNLLNIEIPAGVIEIGSCAFLGCTSLNTINVNEANEKYKSIEGDLYNKSGKTIIQYAIGKTNTSFIIPNTVTIIDMNAFSYCKSLEVVKFAENSELLTISKDSFYNCKNLTNLIIPSTIKSIGENAFSNCSKLVSISFAENSVLESIGENAFLNCTSLEYVEIPSSVKKIGAKVFEKCPIKSAVIPTIVIPYVSKDKLETVTLIDGDVINNKAFYGCNSLTSIIIPNTVKTIGESAFDNCASLTIYCDFKEKQDGWNAKWNSSNCPVVWDYKNNDIADNSCIYTVIGGIRYSIIDNVAMVARQSKNVANTIKIPDTITYKNNVYSVTNIDESAFSSCGLLASIEIPSTLKNIGLNAFKDCASLSSIVVNENNVNYKSIEGNLYSKDGKTLIQYAIGKTDESFTILEDVTSIGVESFAGCKALKEITIPANVEKIEKGAFNKCSALEKITLPFIGESLNGANNTHFGFIFGANAYSNNKDNVPSSLKTIVLTGGDSIKKQAFYNCNGIESVIIPETVAIIGAEAFYNCTALTTIELPTKVSTIDEKAFLNCSSLKRVNYLGSIDNWVNIEFKNDTSNPLNYAKDLYINNELLKNANFSDTTKVSNYALINCTSLESISIPTTVKTIGLYSFAYCNALSNVEIPANITKIDNYAFYGCASLNSISVDEVNENYKSIDGNLYSKDGKTLMQYAIAKTEKNIVISNDVDKISNGAFGYCSSIASIEIPNSVTSIGKDAFYNCSSLEKITLPFIGEAKGGDTNTHFGYIFGADLYENNVNYVPSSLKIAVLTDSDSIPDYAFYNCKYIQAVEVPNTIISIGNYAFSDCYSLSTISFAENSSLERLGSYAFAYCFVLEKVELQSNLISIGERAFYDCDLLESVTFADSCKLESVGSYAFSSCNKLTSIEIPSGVTSIGKGAFYWCDALTSVNFKGDNGLDKIDSYAFSNCRSLNAIKIPNSVISIGENAFSSCLSLAVVDFEGNNELQVINNYAFNDCRALLTIQIPEKVKSIGNYAFADCKTLREVVFAENCKLESIGTYAFRGCAYLENLTLPSTLLSISYGAFYNCSAMANIIMPNEIIHIGKYAFSGCNSLRYNHKDGLKYIGNNENKYLYLVSTESKNAKAVVVDDNCRFIVNDAFSKCIALTSIEIPNSVLFIGNDTFEECSLLRKVYYRATQEDWTKINIGSGNNSLNMENVYFYIENQSELPNDNGNYWHYVDGLPTQWN